MVGHCLMHSSPLHERVQAGAIIATRTALVALQLYRYSMYYVQASPPWSTGATPWPLPAHLGVQQGVHAPQDVTQVALEPGGTRLTSGEQGLGGEPQVEAGRQVVQRMKMEKENTGCNAWKTQVVTLNACQRRAAVRGAVGRMGGYTMLQLRCSCGPHQG